MPPTDEQISEIPKKCSEERRIRSSSPPSQSITENKYVRLVLFTLATFLTSILYYGWQHYSLMLFKGGAYSWVCPDDWTSDEPCEEQDKKVQALYSVATGTEFLFAAIAGWMLDHIGPKATVMLGEAIWGIGILLVAYGTSSSGWMLVVGFFLHGAAVNIIAFPTLILADIFPARRSLMLALCISSQTAATIVPAILWEIWKSNPLWAYTSIIWGYLGIVWLPITVSLAFCMPASRPPIASAPTSRSLSSIPAPSASQFSSIVDGPKKEASLQLRSDIGLEKESTTFDWAKFVWEFTRLDYVVFVIYYIANLLQFMYYPTTIRSEHGRAVSEFFGWMMWTQAPIGLFFGWVCNYTGTTLIAMYLVVSTGLTYILTMIPSEGLQYFTTMMFSSAQSFIYTTKYTWIDEMYSATNYGKLVGFCGCLSGFFTYLNIPVTSSDNNELIYSIYIVVSIVLLFLLGFLYMRQHRWKVSYKDDEKRPLTSKKEPRRSSSSSLSDRAPVAAIPEPTTAEV